MSADGLALVELYDRFAEPIYRYCKYRLFKPELAADMASEVFLRLVQRYDELKALGVERIETWLYSTASGLAANAIRDHKRREEILMDVAREQQRRLSQRLEDGPAALRKMDWPVLHKAMRMLDQEDQDILVLRFFGGIPAVKIAEVLNMDDGAVRMMLSRAMRALKLVLEGPFAAEFEPRHSRDGKHGTGKDHQGP
ncbi:MAG: RNA polymerase sigma factor [Phycisphaerae bacterium]